MMNEDAFQKEAPSSPGASSPSPQRPSTSPIKLTRTESGGVETDIGKFHLEVEARQLPLVGYFLASFIFMVASIAQTDGLGKWYGYAVSVGVIGVVLALVGLVLLKFKSEVDQKFLAYFMLVWSIFGACFMTFGSGPFTVTGNGTFCSFRFFAFA
jgi:bacteriorhodopsin